MSQKAEYTIKWAQKNESKSFKKPPKWEQKYGSKSTLKCITVTLKSRNHEPPKTVNFDLDG